MTDAEKLTLDKDLKFVPPKEFNKFGTFIDVQKYIRKWNIQRQFIAKPTKPQSVAASGGAVSTASYINVFGDLILKDLERNCLLRKYVILD